MKHYIPSNFIHFDASPFFGATTLPESFSQRYTTDNTIYVRLSVMNGSLKYACYSGEEALIPHRERIIQAGCFEVFAPNSWHSIALCTEDSFFNLDFYGLKRG